MWVLQPFSSSKSSINAFAAFAGSTSPFASVKQSPFGSIGGRSTNAFGSFASSSLNDMPSAFGGSLSNQKSDTEERDNGKKREMDHAIDAVEAKVKEAQVKVTRKCNSVSRCAAAIPSHLILNTKMRADVTGEEEEDVEEEIKGVKLFVKRGNKPFASGMVGHLKLLVDKKTSKERLRASSPAYSSICSVFIAVFTDLKMLCQCSDANLSGKCR